MGNSETKLVELKEEPQVVKSVNLHRGTSPVVYFKGPYRVSHLQELAGSPDRLIVVSSVPLKKKFAGNVSEILVDMKTETVSFSGFPKSFGCEPTDVLMNAVQTKPGEKVVVVLIGIADLCKDFRVKSSWFTKLVENADDQVSFFFHGSFDGMESLLTHVVVSTNTRLKVMKAVHKKLLKKFHSFGKMLTLRNRQPFSHLIYDMGCEPNIEIWNPALKDL
jgi:hypothetical protein